ncbi:MAG: M10 family metallopeptidase C-terminal domain-containing protein [Pseudomonadota bacterium]
MSASAHNQIANYLVSGEAGVPRKWSSNTITINYAGVDSSVHWMVQLALDTWESVTGIEFAWTNNASSANIRFDDNDPSGAYSSYRYYIEPNQHRMFDSIVNIPTNWINRYGNGIDTYSFQTYLHEIGHAIGLSHPGPYNGAGVTFGTHAIFPNDSWQASVMSYFSQGENPNVNASNALVITPMIADVLAMWELYGKPNDLRTSNTTYGVGSNAGGVYDQIASLGYRVAFNIVDDGGWDIINFANDTRNQYVNLNAETYSNVYGLIGNMAIMRDTIIEQYIAGSGNDTIIGNTAQNTISGNGGNDTIRSSSNGSNNNKIFGGSGNDVIHVANGQGEDAVFGDAGNDIAIVTNNSGSFSGGSGTDTVRFISGLEKFLFLDNGGEYEFLNVVTRQTFTVNNDVELFQFLNGAYGYNLAQLALLCVLKDRASCLYGCDLCS